MKNLFYLFLFINFSSLSFAQMDSFLGEHLEKKMTLVYQTSHGHFSQHEIIDLKKNIKIKKKNCIQTLISYDDDNEAKTECSDKNYLYLLNKKDQKLLKTRPLASFSSLKKVKEGSKDKVFYYTLHFEDILIFGKKLKVINTHVYVYDNSGNIKYRLIEKFSPQLLTATEGRFEIPSKDSSNGWKTSLEFKLYDIIQN